MIVIHFLSWVILLSALAYCVRIAYDEIKMTSETRKFRKQIDQHDK